MCLKSWWRRETCNSGRKVEVKKRCVDSLSAYDNGIGLTYVFHLFSLRRRSKHICSCWWCLKFEVVGGERRGHGEAKPRIPLLVASTIRSRDQKEIAGYVFGSGPPFGWSQMMNHSQFITVDSVTQEAILRHYNAPQLEKSPCIARINFMLRVTCDQLIQGRLTCWIRRTCFVALFASIRPEMCLERMLIPWFDDDLVPKVKM